MDRGGPPEWRVRDIDHDANDHDRDEKKMSSDGDEDYMEDAEEIDPTVFRIWDPLQKPVTLTYTTEQLHSERVVVVACTN